MCFERVPCLQAVQRWFFYFLPESQTILSVKPIIMENIFWMHSFTHKQTRCFCTSTGQEHSTMERGSWEWPCALCGSRQWTLQCCGLYCLLQVWHELMCYKIKHLVTDECIVPASWSICDLLTFSCFFLIPHHSRCFPDLSFVNKDCLLSW